MKFERLRKSYKKEIIMGALAICIIGGALTFTTSRARYKLTQSIDLVKGTINYKPYDFKIMAMYQQNDSGGYTEINTMPSEGYVINEDNSYCTTDNKTKVKGKIKTVNGIHGLYNITKSDKCYLYFDKYVPPITIPDIIATLNAKPTTPDFSKDATTDEGVYAVNNGMYGGTSYYWRGAVTNNYFKFAGFCWRAIRINEDGTLRLIYDGTTCHANGTVAKDSLALTNQTYNINKDRSEYVGWTYEIGSQRTLGGTSSNIKTQTDNWFTSNITGTNTSKVADGKFCNDRNTASGYSWSSRSSNDFYYAGYDRSGLKDSNQVNPTLSCPDGDVYTMKAGAITMDEVVMAGGTHPTGNSSYYLFIAQRYWTMTPHRWYSTYNWANMFCVSSNGGLSTADANDNPGIRPVINLKADITFASGGTGTQSNPYVVL